MRRLVIVLALLALVPACRKKVEPPPPKPAPVPTTVQVGKRMPPYSTQTLDGKTFDMANERGNVVLLNLWATWCGPCRYEIPELEEMYTKYNSRGFKVVGVSVDEGAPADVQQFVTEQKMTYPIALDPNGRLATLFETTLLPTSAIIDRKGNVVWKSAGVVSGKDPQMIGILEKALAVRP